MAFHFNSKFPSTEDLRQKAKQRMPRFAFEYLDGGCNEDINLHRNTEALREVQLQPEYIKPYKGADMSVNLFGKTYDAPFGIAPIGLQGLMWPYSAQILAKAAHEHNIPFILSTVSTSSIEEICSISAENTWFQLYHPTQNSLRDDILNRVEKAGCKVLVLLCDVPTFGFRPRDIRNGLAMPPKMTFSNLLQILRKPKWAFETLKYGTPNFETLKPYMSEKLNLKQLGKFMDDTFSGRLNEDKIKSIRDQWKGKLILKGVASEADAIRAIELGLDGIIVSNHGGRQLDAGEATIKPLHKIAQKYSERIEVMVDSGLRSGPDIARAIASGAKFTFMGRTFMYGVGALGKKGGDHTIAMLKAQFQQVMEQLCCETTEELKQCLSN